MNRPNIIIFNPDEMRWDSMGHMGNTAAHTPNLDRFAAEDAVSFTRAYCQNPVCVPSRVSFLTGRYPHNDGHRTMRYLMREGERSLFQELMENGYHVWMNDRNDFCARQIPGLLASHASEIHKKKKRPWPQFHYISPYSHYIGVQDEPSWGVMINNARLRLWQGVWWEMTFVTAAIFVLVLVFNHLADELRDILDPALRNEK